MSQTLKAENTLSDHDRISTMTDTIRVKNAMIAELTNRLETSEAEVTASADRPGMLRRISELDKSLKEKTATADAYIERTGELNSEATEHKAAMNLALKRVQDLLEEKTTLGNQVRMFEQSSREANDQIPLLELEIANANDEIAELNKRPDYQQDVIQLEKTLERLNAQYGKVVILTLKLAEKLVETD